MNSQEGQHKDIKKQFPTLLNIEDITIISEKGNDTGETFIGTFVAKINHLGRFKIVKFSDGKMTHF